LEYNSTGTILARNLYGKGIDEILMRVDVTNNWTLYYQQDHEGSEKIKGIKEVRAYY
jgi:hypothetical protein